MIRANEKNIEILLSHVFICIKLTVIIGSNGPKISSDMIAESSGGSTKMVGSINLHRFKHIMFFIFIFFSIVNLVQPNLSYLQVMKGRGAIYKFSSSIEPP